jgi:hypothetical protein
MKARIARSSFHNVRVQKTKFESFNSATARIPGAFFACRAERNAASKKTGKYRNDRTRKRVIETNGMSRRLKANDFGLKRYFRLAFVTL